MKSVAIIIPSCREESIQEFLSTWKFPDYCKLFVIEDNPHKQFNLPSVYYHGSWEDFEEIKDNWIFSKNCGGGIRSFGFYQAWLDNFEYYISLDDDCLPLKNCNGKKFVEEHIKQLETDNGKWIWTTKKVRSRGIPYRNLGHENETLINMGFWKQNADLDAPTQLQEGAIELCPRPHQPAPKGYYLPICGMNLSFKKEAIPMMFQPLMGEQYKVWRFDDIWSGIIIKKICDHLNFLVRTGTPNVKHIRASNIWVNLKKEINGLEMNEEFWQIIDNIKLKGQTIKNCYLEIANVLWKREEPYYQTLGLAMKKWIELLI